MHPAVAAAEPSVQLRVKSQQMSYFQVLETNSGLCRILMEMRCPVSTS